MIAIYAALVVAVFWTIAWNDRIARGRADEIVQALTFYKAQHGDYPTALSALVPEQLAAVPRAKYTLMFNSFVYGYDPIKHRGALQYTTLPPFDMAVFSLETQSWGYHD
jgi:hypothetical protein